MADVLVTAAVWLVVCALCVAFGAYWYRSRHQCVITQRRESLHAHEDGEPCNRFCIALDTDV
jgi:hypothetical protein